ncbi:MAG: sulfur carrier protein ThiS [Myxococcota bacterium]
MNVQLNGKLREVPEACTVQALLVELASDRPGVAVAVDGKVVPRSAHADTPLHEGAVVEVIRAVGGG